MKSVPLTAFPRTSARGRKVKHLRATGRVPAVVYGRLNKPENLEVNAKELNDLIHHSVSENILVDLAVDKANRLALVKEVQHHPLHGTVLHIDFHEVAPDEKVTVMVPVETTGEAAGVKTGGGVLEHVLFKIRVRALPKDLPEQIVIDVTSLEIGKSIHLGDIKVAEGVEILGDKKVSVVSVAQPKTEEEVAPAEGTPAAAGDVEMTKEKKEDGTEGDKPAAKGGDKAAAAKPGDKAPAAAAGDKKAAPAADKKK